MNVKELIELLLSCDDQVIHPRPSSWQEAAELVQILASHAEPSLREEFGEGWQDIDTSATRKRSRV